MEKKITTFVRSRGKDAEFETSKYDDALRVIKTLRDMGYTFEPGTEFARIKTIFDIRRIGSRPKSG